MPMWRYVNLRVERLENSRWSFVKDSLLLLVCLQIWVRARRNRDRSIDGLEQWEFFLSEEEYEKFWLLRSQKGQITRRLQKLIETKFIVKVEGKTGSRWWNVYRLVDSFFITPFYQNREQNSAKIENKQRMSRDEEYKSNSNKNNSVFLTSEQVSSMDENELIQNYWGNHDLYLKTLGEEKTKEVKTNRIKRSAK